MKPLVSVVIPAYNRAAFLPGAVETVLKQGPIELEVVIVDDGSTDDTAAVVAGLPGPVRYHRQENAGPAAARQRGILEARGEYVALLDSDDGWQAGKLAAQLEILKSQPQVGMVHTAARLIDVHGVPTGAIWGKPDYRGEVFDKLLVANGVNASSVLMRRSLALEVGGYDTRMRSLENWDLWLRLSRRCLFAYLDTPLIDYRVHDGNLIRDLSRLQDNYRYLLTKHLEASEPLPSLRVRARSYARFHQSFADALTGQGRLQEAQGEFLRSLLWRPAQPGVWWRLFRVSTRRGRVSA